MPVAPGPQCSLQGSIQVVVSHAGMRGMAEEIQRLFLVSIRPNNQWIINPRDRAVWQLWPVGCETNHVTRLHLWKQWFHEPVALSLWMNVDYIIKVSCIVFKSTWNGQLNFCTSLWRNGSDDVLYNHTCTVILWLLKHSNFKKKTQLTVT